MTSASPAKRARGDKEAPSSITHSKFWYSDGSVVLQVETTQFRVHASILSASSAVLKDMFQVAQAPTLKWTDVPSFSCITILGRRTFHKSEQNSSRRRRLEPEDVMELTAFGLGLLGLNLYGIRVGHLGVEFRGTVIGHLGVQKRQSGRTRPNPSARPRDAHYPRAGVAAAGDRIKGAHRDRNSRPAGFYTHCPGTSNVFLHITPTAGRDAGPNREYHESYQA
ncbi:hypothetical protein K438DRAFT_1769330 [Mycena galopus ATCC 62051]|nr:hypothetical protein K438DRAFT_1769330 [Mycena galopus ATCC 62051]